MTSFNYHLSLIYVIKECSSCGSFYTSNCGCLKGSLEDKILVPIPDSPQQPIIIEKICFDCGDLVRGLYCRECAPIRKTFEEVFQDFQDTSESTNDNTNAVNATREEPLPGQTHPVKISDLVTKLPQISCGKGAHYGYNCPPKVPIITNQEPCNTQIISEPLQNLQSLQQQCLLAIKKKEEEKRIAEEQAAKDRYWKISICYDDDEDDTIIITSVLPIEEPVNSLSMGDKHLDTIPETESDKFIKSSVEILVQILSESEGIPDKMCDVPLCENTTPLNALNEHSEIVVNSNDDNSSSDDDSTYGEDIDYVDASPPDDEIVSLEEVEIVNPEIERINDDILLTIKDDTLRDNC
ncbi:hypothetical protein Tco_0465306 [Tanacetum coccineum]